MHRRTRSWPEIYEMFDGTMNACPGKNCKTPCCPPKRVGMETSGFISCFNTTLYDRSELAFFKLLVPNWAELEIVFDEVRTRSFKGNSAPLILMNGCLGPDGCKLPREKPLACRVYPFYFSTEDPLSCRCPVARDIARSLTVRRPILEVRRALGFTDDEDQDRWVEACNAFCFGG